MKRTLAMLMGAIILLTCVLGGCGAQTDGNATLPEDESNELSVYVVKTDALYVKAVNAFKREAKDQYPDLTLNITTFDTYEAMLDVMNIELMAKGGPDVVLYNCMQGQVDAQKLAQSGMFLPLDSFVKELDPEIYPAALMDAGHIAGKQYFIPLSYNLIYTFATGKLMEEQGYSVFDNIYETILSETDALINNNEKLSYRVTIKRPDNVNSFFDAAGVTFFDKNTGDVIVDKAEVEELCRFLKSALYDNWEKYDTLKKSVNDFSDMLKVYSFFSEDYAFMHNIRFYQSLIPSYDDSQMIAIPLHKLNNPEELCASIVCFGGVNANSKAPGKAYALLKYILDFNVTNSFMKYEESQVYYAPVSLAAYQKAIEELTNSMGVGPVTIKQLSEENGLQLTEIPQKITEATIPNMALGVSIGEIFEPYLMGQDSFDNCYKTFLNRLQLYVSE